MKKITAEFLRQEPEVCKPQIAIFESEWPDGAEVNEANLKRALELGLDLGWLIMQKMAMAPAWAEYERARVAAWAENKRVHNAIAIPVIIKYWPEVN